MPSMGAKWSSNTSSLNRLKLVITHAKTRGRLIRLCALAAAGEAAKQRQQAEDAENSEKRKVNANEFGE